jgi:DNA-binding CsgD family transcriptional regulator
MFNKVKTLLNDDLEDISVINSSSVLYGAKEGFIVYNPLVDFPADNNFNTYLRSVIISSTSDSLIFAGNFSEEYQIVQVQPKNSLPLMPYEYNSIRFTYSANFMNDYDQTMYQHMLEGFEDHWSAWHLQAENGYTNLSEGDYSLRVRAKNIYNTQSIETVYKFSILSPWYRSRFAYAGYSLLFLTSFLLVFGYMDRKYRESKINFELKKQLEVDEIGNRLESLTQKTTEEIDKLKSEKLQSEVEFKNAELASSTMNLINKNKFIAHIKSDLSSIAKRSSSSELISELNKINKEIDKNISRDDDWDQFTFHFNSVHGDFTTRLTAEFGHLSGQDIRLCSYLRLNLSTKEIAQLLNISIRGVEISRYRLRKKLKLQRTDNLAEFILNY